MCFKNTNQFLFCCFLPFLIFLSIPNLTSHTFSLFCNSLFWGFLYSCWFAVVLFFLLFLCVCIWMVLDILASLDIILSIFVYFSFFFLCVFIFVHFSFFGTALFFGVRSMTALEKEHWSFMFCGDPARYFSEPSVSIGGDEIIEEVPDERWYDQENESPSIDPGIQIHNDSNYCGWLAENRSFSQIENTSGMVRFQSESQLDELSLKGGELQDWSFVVFNKKIDRSVTQGANSIEDHNMVWSRVHWVKFSLTDCDGKTEVW